MFRQLLRLFSQGARESPILSSSTSQRHISWFGSKKTSKQEEQPKKNESQQTPQLKSQTLSSPPSSTSSSSKGEPTSSLQLYQELLKPGMSQVDLTTREFISRGYNLKTSTRKLYPIANQVRGLNYFEAIGQLTFSPKKAAKFLRDLVHRARLNAEKTFGADPSRLLITQIHVGKGNYLKQLKYHARGRSGMAYRYRTHVTVILKHIPEIPGEERLGKFGKKKKPENDNEVGAISFT